MPILRWQETFNIGIEQFDVHHQHLAVLLNSIYDNFMGGSPAENLGLIIDELRSYTIYHFNAEERWMAGVGYLKLAQHREMHNDFKKRLEEIWVDFSTGGNDVALETLILLSSWLSNHILEADADFAGYLPKS